MVAAVAAGLADVSVATTYYVATNGTGNGTSPESATNSIQGAIDLCSSGDAVVVGHGVYETGGLTNFPAGSLAATRVVFTKNNITVQSVDNDPSKTIIKGAWDPAATHCGPAAVRCAYLSTGSSLIGFTLTNGATEASWGLTGRGGGVYAASTSPKVSNCVIVANASYFGGGAGYCTLYNCLLSNNYSQGGGGTHLSILYGCKMIGNSAYNTGGASFCTLYDCLVAGNTNSGTTAEVAGGMSHCIAYNCTVVSNVSTRGETGGVAGLPECKLWNCIVYFNTGTNAASGNWYESSIPFTNCCTTPLPTGSSNITNNPAFVDPGAGNWRLSADSPCLNAGTNQAWMTTTYPYDLDGNARIRYTHVDIGAYERYTSGTLVHFR